MKPENYEQAWYMRYIWYRCTAPAGQVLVNACTEAEARSGAAARIGVPPETMVVVPCPEMGERYRFLCRATERELANGGPRLRRR